eukprot:2014239-Rhodomonas_salina.3
MNTHPHAWYTPVCSEPAGLEAVDSHEEVRHVSELRSRAVVVDYGHLIAGKSWARVDSEGDSVGDSLVR